MPDVPALPALIVAPVLPGEAAIVAIAKLITVIAEGQTVEQREVLWNRYIEMTEPFHARLLAMHRDFNDFLDRLKAKVAPADLPAAPPRQS